MTEVLLTGALGFVAFISYQVWKMQTNCIPTINRQLDKIEGKIDQLVSKKK